MNFKQIKSIIIPEGSVVKIIDPNGLNLWQKPAAFDGLCFTALEDGSFGMEHFGTNQDETKPVLQYSRDGVEWNDWDYEPISVEAGDQIYWRGDNTGIGSSTANHSRFTATGLFEASGNTMSILSNQGLSDYCFSYLFQDCTTLVQAPELPATTLAAQCYRGMFRNCTSLVQAPVLPATELIEYCYGYMFRDCTSLLQVPELPATKLAKNCYRGMFYDHKNLVQAPELPATELVDYCYHTMFYGCESLVQAPELPATTLKDHCYNGMFTGCTSLVQAPDLPATTSDTNCYNSMFQNCTSLQKTGVIATECRTSDSTEFMFGDCTSLKEMTWAVTTPRFILSKMWVNCPTDMIIYVPDESVDAYKAATGWRARADYIKPMSEKPTE